jgi:transposase
MYIEKVPNRNSPPAILLREGWREGKKTHKRTIANISSWPAHKIEMLRRLLRDETLVPAAEGFQIQRSLPHGHVAAVLGLLWKVGLDKLILSTTHKQKNLVLAMIVTRIIEPASKLATARGFGLQTASSSLGQVLGIETADEEDLYGAMDWLLKRQVAIEKKLAKRHLAEGTMVLYDVTSTYFEGRSCSLAHFGHNRDGKKGKLQIAVGLLCNQQGCPIAVEVFDGNTGDPKTLGSQIQKVRDRFGLNSVVFVGDRGMLTEARIAEELNPVEGLDWITALRAPAIHALFQQGVLQPSLFDEMDLAEISSPEYPDERLIVCRNPLLAEERRRKRQALLEATEQELAKVVKATQRDKRRLKGADKIGVRVGKVLNRYKVGKHFRLEISEDSFRYERDEAKIALEAALDGIYVIRTSVPDNILDAQHAVRTYKNLSVVERAFRSMKSVDLKVRPIHHRLADRVRAHVFLCMLAYYVEWHMRKALAPMLFDDDDKAEGEALRESIVAPARRSPKAERKARSKRTEEGLPVHSFQSLLKDLATITRNKVMVAGETFDEITMPTAVQKRAFDLLEISLKQ